VGQLINGAGKIPVGASSVPVVMDLGAGHSAYLVGYGSKLLAQAPAAGKLLSGALDFFDGKAVVAAMVYLGAEISCGVN